MFSVEEREVKYGRFVTVITFSGDVGEAELRRIARHLKKRLGTGGTVKNGAIILQGRHKARVAKLLPALLT